MDGWMDEVINEVWHGREEGRRREIVYTRESETYIYIQVGNDARNWVGGLRNS